MLEGFHQHGDTSWWLFNPEIVSAHQLLFSDETDFDSLVEKKSNSTTDFPWFLFVLDSSGEKANRALQENLDLEGISAQKFLLLDFNKAKKIHKDKSQYELQFISVIKQHHLTSTNKVTKLRVLLFGLKWNLVVTVRLLGNQQRFQWATAPCQETA